MVLVLAVSVDQAQVLRFSLPRSGGELAAFSMGATYGEESEGAEYIPGATPGLMPHAEEFCAARLSLQAPCCLLHSLSVVLASL